MAMTVRKWVLLPLRLFLGVTFVYAGIQKLLDTQFFQPAAGGFIGKQLAGFAHSSPLGPFMLSYIVPYALAFGLLVAYGEIAIGLGTLIGLLLRPAAFFGLLLSLILFLTATWTIYPYFYGSDIVFVFCWLTLLLNGPRSTGLPTLDMLWLAQPLSKLEKRRPRIARLLQGVLGIREADQFERDNEEVQSQELERFERTRETRRGFLLGMISGGVGATLLFVFGSASQLARQTTATPVVTASSTPFATATAPASTVITTTSSVPKNSAFNFVLPSGDAGIVIHLTNDEFVAYNALCTHAACDVNYDADTQLLICPCHGSQFDPARAGQVEHRPATRSLETIKIQVNSATGEITLAE